MRRLFTLLVLLTPAVLMAQDSRFELTPTVGYMWGGSITLDDQAFTHQTYDVDLGDAGAFSLVLGIPVARQTWLEVIADRQSTALVDSQGLFGEEPAWIVPPGDTNTLDVDVTYYQVGVQRELTSGPTRWFVTASAGVSYLDFALPIGNTSNLSATVGGGVKLSLNDRLGLRLGAKVLWSATDENAANIQYFEHQDCGYTCYYVYGFKPSFLQTELSLGLTIKL